MTINKTPFRN